METEAQIVAAGVTSHRERCIHDWGSGLMMQMTREEIVSVKPQASPYIYVVRLKVKQNLPYSFYSVHNSTLDCIASVTIFNQQSNPIDYIAPQPFDPIIFAYKKKAVPSCELRTTFYTQNNII
ncbi:hypothetical protein V9T40_002993 [Parthenolecanium corni]|uniref:Uncharacterized protein n=1 Tax=Parthenolecanium corni TaxID=536013 RepID=A0AAN9TPQ5_9HEMI